MSSIVILISISEPLASGSRFKSWVRSLGQLLTGPTFKKPHLTLFQIFSLLPLSLNQEAASLFAD